MDVEVDYDTSSVRLGDRWYPSVLVVCPPVDGDGRDHDDRVDYSLVGGVLATIPLENGALIEVVEDTRDGEPVQEVYLLSRWCALDNWQDEPQWIPEFLDVVGTTLTRSTGRHVGFAHHFDPDPEWLGEWIDRVSRMTVPPGDGPQVSYLPMKELPAMLTRLHDRIQARRRGER